MISLRSKCHNLVHCHRILLIGVPIPSGKRGPQPRLLQQIERIQRLPRPQQRFVMQMIDTALQASATQAAE